MATFLRFCIFSPFFSLGFFLFFDVKWDFVRALSCFLWFLLCIFVFPIFCLRNAVNSLKDPSYLNLRFKSFLQAYTSIVQSPYSFLFYAFFVCAPFGYIAFFLKKEFRNFLENEVFASAFSYIFVWLLVSALIRKIAEAIKIKSEELATNSLSLLIDSQLPHFLKADKWRSLSCNPNKKDKSTPWYIYYPYCIFWFWIQLIRFLWENVCLFLGAIVVWYLPIFQGFLPIKKWVQTLPDWPPLPELPHSYIKNAIKYTAKITRITEEEILRSELIQRIFLLLPSLKNPIVYSSVPCSIRAKREIFSVKHINIKLACLFLRIEEDEYNSLSDETVIKLCTTVSRTMEEYDQILMTSWIEILV